VTQAVSRHIRFRSRSFPALVLEPEAPLAGWIDRLDAYLACTPAFFSRKAIVIDVANLGLERAALRNLLSQLIARNIRLLGVTGVDPAWASDDLPPILTGGRIVEPAHNDDAAANGKSLKSGLTREELAAFDEIAGALKGESQTSEIAAQQVEKMEPQLLSPLVIDAPVRSGQTIFFPQGDVIVVGPVSSGADVIAGGSIHIYGALRGRAMAGAYGETQARIFCRRLEAELLAIGGVYLTADEMEENMLGKNVQIWLDRDDVKIARLD